MTLIAAFRVFGTPALLGDLLITAPKSTATRKKLVLVADNVAVAWTGHLVAAQQVFSALQDSVPRTATFQWLSDTLTALDPTDFGTLEVTLVGWVVDDGQATCFRWRSDYGHEVFTGDPMTDGSGDDFVCQYLGPLGLTTTDPLPLEYQEQRDALVRLVGELMRTEMHGPTNRALGFGHGYEAVLLGADGRFDYIDVLYYAVEYKMSSAGNLESFRLIQPFAKVTHPNGCTVIESLDTDEKSEKRELITPPGQVDPQVEAKLLSWITSRNRKFDLLSASYCQFVYFDAPEFKDVFTVHVHGPTPSGLGLVVDEEKSARVTVSREIIEFVYKSIKDDQASAIGRRSPPIGLPQTPSPLQAVPTQSSLTWLQPEAE